MEDYINIEALDQERKDGHHSGAGEDYEDMQDLHSANDASLPGKGPSSSKKSDLSVRNENWEYYSDGDGQASARETSVVQTKELKPTLDEATESDYENVSDKRPGKISVKVKRRAPFSLKLGRGRKKKKNMKTPRLETTDDDQYETLDGFAAVMRVASPNMRYQPQPIAMCQPHDEETPESAKMTSLTFGEENADIDPEDAHRTDSSNVGPLRATSYAALDRRLSTLWRAIFVLSSVSICAVVVAVVGVYIAMATSSDGNNPLQFRDYRTHHGQETNRNINLGKNFKTSALPFA